MKLSLTSQVADKKCYDVIPKYTSKEKNMMGDIPVYNFDTIIDYSPNNPDPKILFSTSYDHNEDYRSMFALTANQVKGLIVLLQDSLNLLEEQKESQILLESTIKEFGDYLYNSINGNSNSVYRVIIEELSEKKKNLQTLHGDTIFISLKKTKDNSLNEFNTVIRMAIDIDKEILLAIESCKARTTNNRIDKVKELTAHVVKTKLIGLLINESLKYNKINIKPGSSEFNNICKKVYDSNDFIFIFDDSDNGRIKTLIKKNEEESKKIIEDLDSVMKGPKDLGPTLIPLNKPKPIKAMTNEEAKKISENFMKEYNNKK